MSVTIKNGIGFSTRTGAMYIDMGADSIQPSRRLTNVPVEDKTPNVPWAKWGNDNLLPFQMFCDIDQCGILSSIIDGKARFSINNGVLPALVHYDNAGQMVIDDIVMAPEIQDFLEDNNSFHHCYGWMKDQCGFGNGIARFMLDKERKRIASFQRDDITEMRYQKQNNQGKIENIYLCADWKKATNAKYKGLVTVPLLDWNNPLLDLREKATNSKAVEFAMTFKYPGWGKKYYSTPLWYAAHKWVKIAQGVPEMKAAMFENNFRPKYLVIISEKYWDKVFDDTAADKTADWKDYTDKQIAEKKNKVYDDIDAHLAGNMNAYKTVFVDGYHTPEGKLVPEIEIRPIDDTTKAGELLPDSAAANSEIAFAMLFNPAIIGANMPSGPYTNSQGGSNVRESTLIQVIIHELERKNVQRIFNVIKRFNEWDSKYVKDPEKQKLEFIIPATIPTTLDTGSNVKPIVTGVSPVQNSNQDKAA